MSPGPAGESRTTQLPPGYWSLVAAGEPFRLLFPLGAALGIFGVLMWPLYIWKVTTVFPGQIHPRIMIEGFLTSFVVGFLGTALPRLLGAPRMALGETLGFAVALVGLSFLHATGRVFWGDQVFFLTVLLLAGLLGTRALLFRKDSPPPAFVLVALGLGCALFGSATQAMERFMPASWPVWVPVLGKLLLYQGYLVFPIMGVGAFLLPRFFGLPGRQNFPESLALPPGWLGRAGFALFCGAVVMTGYVVQAVSGSRWGNAFCAAGILLYFVREIPFHKAGFGGGSIALGLRLALFSIPLAYILLSLLPGRSFSLLHILFITGFSLLVFIVASRIVLGHSGQSRKFRDKLWPVLVLTALITLAMLTRVTADWMPDLRMNHYAYAALVWSLGVMVWSAAILPRVRCPDA